MSIQRVFVKLQLISFYLCQFNHFRIETGVTEVDSGIKREEFQPVSQSTPIPKVVISGVGPDEEPKEKGEHDKDSDAGSLYDGSIYGTDSHNEDSREDLASKGHLDLHLK